LKTIEALGLCLSIPGGLFSCPKTFVYIFVYRNVEYAQVNRISKQRRKVGQVGVVLPDAFEFAAKGALQAANHWSFKRGKGYELAPLLFSFRCWHPLAQGSSFLACKHSCQHESHLFTDSPPPAMWWRRPGKQNRM
jgi:hypothetical protein